MNSNVRRAADSCKRNFWLTLIFRGKAATKRIEAINVQSGAAEQVRSGETVLFDDSSTTFQLASNLESKAPLTVVTNSIAVIAEISRFRGVQLKILVAPTAERPTPQCSS